jgi:hypothetical protein
VRIDMSEYQHSHTVSNLTGKHFNLLGSDIMALLIPCLGSPKGYVVCSPVSHRPSFKLTTSFCN